MIVQHFMVPLTSVRTCLPGTSVMTVGQILSGAHIGSIVVVNEAGQAIGIITKADLLRAVFVDKMHFERCKARDVMSSQNLSCAAPTTPCQEAAETMALKKHHHLLITEDGTPAGTFLGIVTSMDIARESAADAKAWPWNREAFVH